MEIEIGPNLTQVLLEQLKVIARINDGATMYEALSEFNEATKHLISKAIEDKL